MRVALLALGAVGALTAVDLPFPQYHLLGALSVTVFGTAAASYVTGGFRRSVVSFSLMGTVIAITYILFTGNRPMPDDRQSRISRWWYSVAVPIVTLGLTWMAWATLHLVSEVRDTPSALVPANQLLTGPFLASLTVTVAFIIAVVLLVPLFSVSLWLDIRQFDGETVTGLLIGLFTVGLRLYIWFRLASQRPSC